MIKLYSNRTGSMHYFVTEESFAIDFPVVANAGDYILFENEEDLKWILSLNRDKYDVDMIDTDITETDLVIQYCFSNEIEIGCGVYVIDTVKMLNSIMFIRLSSVRRKMSYLVKELSKLYQIEKMFADDKKEGE